LHLALIFPPHRCGTAEVYRCFDAITESPRVDPGRVRALAQSKPLPAERPFNDLTEAAYEVVPVLRDIHRDLCVATEKPVHLSGSGAAKFVIAQSADEVEMIVSRITKQTGLPAIATHTLP
jgi:4-diphosphocytidyl-2C-methyl-D-erythritol kinase